MERGIESVQLWVVLRVAENDAPQVQVNSIGSWVGDGLRNDSKTAFVDSILCDIGVANVDAGLE